MPRVEWTCVDVDVDLKRISVMCSSRLILAGGRLASPLRSFESETIAHVCSCARLHKQCIVDCLTCGFDLSCLDVFGNKHFYYVHD